MYQNIKIEVSENLNDQLTYHLNEPPFELYWFVCEALLGKYKLNKITMEYLLSL